MHLNKQNIYSLLEELLKIRLNKEKMIYSLLLNTHCMGCGRKNIVSLIGYCGEYCTKRCWKIYDDPNNSGREEEHINYQIEKIHNKYKYLGYVDTTSKALSKYHREYRNHMSESKFVWPMVNKPCYNVCIMNKKSIKAY